MFILISIVAIIAMVVLFSPNDHRDTHHQEAYTNATMPPSQVHNFIQPQMPGPMYSPDRRYIWDAYRQTWVRHYSFGDVVMYLALGFAAAVGLLSYLGFIQ